MKSRQSSKRKTRNANSSDKKLADPPDIVTWSKESNSIQVRKMYAKIKRREKVLSYWKKEKSFLFNEIGKEMIEDLHQKKKEFLHTKIVGILNRDIESGLALINRFIRIQIVLFIKNKKNEMLSSCEWFEFYKKLEDTLLYKN